MDYDVIIVGGGPAGYVAAIRAGQLGLKTLLVEKSNLGGMCLNWGCIPLKSLLESARRYTMVKDAATFGVDGVDPKQVSFNWTQAVRRSERIVNRLTKGIAYLLKKNGVEWLNSEAAISSEHAVRVQNRQIEADHLIIATGSKPGKLPVRLPQEVGLELENLLQLKNLPERPIVVGEGAVAVELAQFFHLVGKPVTLVLSGSDLLPRVDSYLTLTMERIFKKMKVEIISASEIKGYEEGVLLVDGNKVPGDCVLNASPREMVLPDSGVNLELENGFLKVDSLLRTSAEPIFAVGDVNGWSAFAHSASAQGYHAVNVINGVETPMNAEKYPVNIYTIPEFAQIGMTEERIRDNKIDYKISEFPLSANSKALIEGAQEGFVRIISERKYGEVLGVQIVAPHATDMIAEAALMLQLEGTVLDVSQVIHAHPTISEAYSEAGFAAFDQAIHI